MQKYLFLRQALIVIVNILFSNFLDYQILLNFFSVVLKLSKQFLSLKLLNSKAIEINFN